MSQAEATTAAGRVAVRVIHTDEEWVIANLVCRALGFCPAVKNELPKRTKMKLKNERTTMMLTKAKTLKGYKLDALDGEIGDVKEFYFDNHYWTIRYLVADTGNWLSDRQVLISPHALGAVNKEEQHITIDLTKKQIEDSPPLDSDKPVSRQFEETYYGHFGFPTYWGGPYMWGAFPYPHPYMASAYTTIVPEREKSQESIQAEKAWDPHLSSTHDVSGHHVQAEDGEIGHVEDFIIDDATWAIRYLIIDTQNWWPGKHVLLSPKWIERIGRKESKIFVNLPRETIKQSPEYTEESLLTRDYETGLHRHYDRQGYWVDEPVAKEQSR